MLQIFIESFDESFDFGDFSFQMQHNNRIPFAF